MAQTRRDLPVSQTALIQITAPRHEPAETGSRWQEYRRIADMFRHNPLQSLAAAVLVSTFGTTALAGSLTVEKVELWNKPDGSQGMTVSAERVKAGTVLFEVTNVSNDEDHELLLLKTNLKPDQFPVDDSGTRLDEDKLPGIHELGDLTKGETSKHKLVLTPGRYVMFCNEPGHYAAGMWHELIVTP